MNADTGLTRRSLMHGALLLAVGNTASRRRASPGSMATPDGFAAVVPGRAFTFPADHGPHPDYRIERRYVTGNLRDATGRRCAAVDLVSSDHAPRPAGRWLSQPTDLDEATPR